MVPREDALIKELGAASEDLPEPPLPDVTPQALAADEEARGSEVRVSEELEVLRTVAGRLDAAHIPYMLTGAMALNYYAVPRMTRDIDLVVELGPGDADRLVQLFEHDFYVEPEAVRSARSQTAASSTSSTTPSS